MFRSEMSVPIYRDNATEFPKNIPISHGNERSYSAMGSRALDDDFRQKTRRGSISDPFHSKDLDPFEDRRQLRRNNESENWFEDTRRRFEERRRQWDEDINRMRADFFKPINRFEPESEIRKFSTSPALEKRVSTKYEYGGDGKLYFMAKFDIREYNPNDVKVTVRNGELIVKAFTQRTLSGSSRTNEFTRSIYLPSDVDQMNISATMSDDNMLEVKCPIHSSFRSPTPVYKIVTGSTQSSNMNDKRPVPNTSASEKYLGQYTPIDAAVKDDVPANWKFNVDIPIGQEYGPSEIQVRTMNNRVYVSARHEERISTQNTFREFSREYNIPDNINPKSVTATLEGGILHLAGYPYSRKT